jgi:hypothetical protein
LLLILFFNLRPESAVDVLSRWIHAIAGLFGLGLNVERISRAVIRNWNWKAAVLSSLPRAGLFFAVNLGAGVHSALRAMATELGYRGITAGFYGGLTQAASRAHPRKAAAATACILVASHTVEFIVHWLRGTPNLRSSIVASACFTVLSTLFNLHAMRRGVLVTGSGSASLLADLRALPQTLASFGASLLGTAQ